MAYVIVSEIKEEYKVWHRAGICVAYYLEFFESKWIFFREFHRQCYFAVVSNTFIQTELQICHFERLVAFQTPLLKNKDSCTICRCAFVLEIVLAFHLVALSSKIFILYVASVASSGRVIGNKDLTQISQQVQSWDRERKEKSHNWVSKIK